MSILISVYGKAKKLPKKTVDEITEDHMNSLCEEFLHMDVPYESKKCKGFVNTLLKRKKNYRFRFVINRSVESTNNRAERAMRPIVTYRKVSGGSRSMRGAKGFTKVYSVPESRRKKGKLPFRANPG